MSDEHTRKFLEFIHTVPNSWWPRVERMAYQLDIFYKQAERAGMTPADYHDLLQEQQRRRRGEKKNNAPIR